MGSRLSSVSSQAIDSLLSFYIGLHHKSFSTGFRADKMTISIPISTKLGF